jgi:hypothetical protein
VGKLCERFVGAAAFPPPFTAIGDEDAAAP